MLIKSAQHSWEDDYQYVPDEVLYISYQEGGVHICTLAFGDLHGKIQITRPPGRQVTFCES